MEFIFDKNIIAKNIKHLRKSKKLTQGALSDIIGAKTTTFSNWETGVSLPELDKIINISNYFGVSIDNILLLPFEKWPSEIGSMNNLVKSGYCDRCIEKDMMIDTQKDTIDALKEAVRQLKSNIHHLEEEHLEHGLLTGGQKRKTG